MTTEATSSEAAVEPKKRATSLKSLERVFAHLSEESVKEIKSSEDLMQLRDVTLPKLIEIVDAECKVRAAKLAGK